MKVLFSAAIDDSAKELFIGLIIFYYAPTKSKPFTFESPFKLIFDRFGLFDIVDFMLCFDLILP